MVNTVLPLTFDTEPSESDYDGRSLGSVHRVNDPASGKFAWAWQCPDCGMTFIHPNKLEAFESQKQHPGVCPMPKNKNKAPEVIDDVDNSVPDHADLIKLAGVHAEYEQLVNGNEKLAEVIWDLIGAINE